MLCIISSPHTPFFFYFLSCSILGGQPLATGGGKSRNVHQLCAKSSLQF